MWREIVTLRARARACVELLVGTLFVAKGGALIIGTAAAPVTALARVLWRDDKAINSTVDPEQYQVSYFVFVVCLFVCAVVRFSLALTAKKRKSAWPRFIGSSYDSRTSYCASVSSSQEEFDGQRLVLGRGARCDAV